MTASLSEAARIAAVVLNWNGGQDTLDCLASLNASARPFDTVIVADNGSTDGSVQRIRDRFPNVIVVENGLNLGFAGGNNRGIRVALERDSDFVLLLNNDATLDVTALGELLAAVSAHPEAGVLAGKIFFADGSRRLWYAGAKWHGHKQYFEHVGYGQVDGQMYSAATATDYASGCALFARSEVFRKIGLLDERFFLTYEETDFCYRARAAGYEILYVPEARFEHKISASFGGESTPLHDYFYTRNILLWGERHLSRKDFVRLLGKTAREVVGLPPKAYALAATPRRLLWALRTAGRRAVGLTDSPSVRARFLGLRDYLSRRFGDCPQEVRDLCRLPRKEPAA